MRKNRRQSTRPPDPSGTFRVMRAQRAPRPDSGCRTASRSDHGTGRSPAGAGADRREGKESTRSPLTVERHWWSEMFGYWG
jgi:hypothetical protein